MEDKVSEARFVGIRDPSCPVSGAGWPPRHRSLQLGSCRSCQDHCHAPSALGSGIPGDALSILPETFASSRPDAAHSCQANSIPCRLLSSVPYF